MSQMSQMMRMSFFIGTGKKGDKKDVKPRGYGKIKERFHVGKFFFDYFLEDLW